MRHYAAIEQAGVTRQTQAVKKRSNRSEAVIVLLDVEVQDCDANTGQPQTTISSVRAVLNCQ